MCVRLDRCCEEGVISYWRHRRGRARKPSGAMCAIGAMWLVSPRLFSAQPRARRYGFFLAI